MIELISKEIVGEVVGEGYNAEKLNRAIFAMDDHALICGKCGSNKNYPSCDHDYTPITKQELFLKTGLDAR